MITVLHCFQVHSYPWSAITPFHTLPVPALLPGTLISLVSHYTSSHSTCSCTASRYTHTLSQPLHLLTLYLFQHCCQVHSYPWSAITPPHTLPVPTLLPGTLISLVSHYTFSYSTCSYTAARYTHIWSAIKPPHTLPVPALLSGTLISLVSH